MLIDYHLHLEEDNWSGPCRYDVRRIGEYVDVALRRGLTGIGISEHCHRFPEFKPVMRPLMEPVPVAGGYWLQEHFNQSLEAYVAAVLAAKRRGMPVKLGIEVDYLPGSEDQLRDILASYPWDFVIGSVHFLDGWAIDVGPQYGWPDVDVDTAYRQYFQRLLDAVHSRLFDIIAHPDLIKKFGHRPSYDLQPTFDRLCRALATTGTALELSSAGIRKPVGEPYPSAALLKCCARAGVLITLGSDAHRPQDVGKDFDVLVSLARACGYETAAVFEGRKIRTEPLTDLKVEGREFGD